MATPTPKIGFSLSTSLKKPPQPPSKRPHSSLLDDTDAPPHSDAPATATEILEFGGSSARTDKARPPERVIKPAPSTDWITEYRKKRMKASAPPAAPPSAQLPAGKEVMASSVTGGLQLPSHPAPAQTEEGEEASTPAPEPIPAPTREITNQDALAALLEDRAPEQETIAPQDESDAYAADHSTAAADPDLEDYARVPVEGFGAAILRGFLRPGETLDNFSKKHQDKKIEKRPALLGLGAKSAPGGDLELGAWGKGAKDVQYNPLARKNVRTGEVMGETDFQKRLREQAEGQGGNRERRDGERKRGDERRHRDDDRDDRRHRREDDRDDKRHRDRDRERRRERDDRHARDSGRDSRRDRDRDRERSHRHDRR